MENLGLADGAPVHRVDLGEAEPREPASRERGEVSMPAITLAGDEGRGRA